MTSLATPITLRSGATARNRLALAPLTNQQSHRDGTISGDEHAWLERRAAGGFAIVETCAAHVSPDGQGFPGQLGVWGDHQLPGLRALAAAIAGHGALGLVQLYHGGVRCPPLSPASSRGAPARSTSRAPTSNAHAPPPPPTWGASSPTSSPPPPAPPPPASTASSSTPPTATSSASSSAAR